MLESRGRRVLRARQWFEEARRHPFPRDREAEISDASKQAVDADATDAVNVGFWDAVFPKPGGGAYDVVPRLVGNPVHSPLGSPCERCSRGSGPSA